MKLFGTISFVLCCSSLTCWIELSHGRPHGIDEGRRDRGLQRRELGQPRHIIVVTEVSHQDDERDQIKSRQMGRTVYPAHTYFVVEPTPDDAALRVELVAPTVNRKQRGMAIAITDYRSSTVSDDLREVYGPLPERTQRFTHRLERPMTATNADLFDPFLRSRSGGMRGAVEEMWLANAFAQIGPGAERWASALIGNSHEFVKAILNTRHLRLDTRDFLASETMAALKQGEEWATLQRMKISLPLLGPKVIDHIFYEVPRQPPGSAARVPTFRALFDIDKTRTPFEPRRVNLNAAQTMIDPNMPLTRSEAVILSRDPHLTSNARSNEDRGLFGIGSKQTCLFAKQLSTVCDPIVEDEQGELPTSPKAGDAADEVPTAPEGDDPPSSPTWANDSQDDPPTSPTASDIPVSSFQSSDVALEVPTSPKTNGSPTSANGNAPAEFPTSPMAKDTPGSPNLPKDTTGEAAPPPLALGVPAR